MSTWKNKDTVLGLLSLSFDRRQRAESANRREKQKLQSEQRNLDLYKSEALKILSATETKLKSKSQRLLKQNQASSIRDSPARDKTSSLPVIRVPDTSASSDVGFIATDIESQYLYKSGSLTEFSHDNLQMSTYTSTNLSSSLGKQPKLPAIRQARTQSSKEKPARRRRIKSTSDINKGFVNPKETNDNSDTSGSMPGQTRRSYRNLGEMAGTSSDLETPRLSSRRRSLSLNDIPLAERISAFLESVELAKNSQSSSDEEIVLL